MEIRDFLVDKDEIIMEAMRKLDRNGYGIIFICENEMLKGSLSDGDFRRYMLKGGDINQNVGEIANSNPHFLTLGDGVDSVQYIRNNRIKAIPIVDKQGEIVRIDFENGNSVFKKLENPIPVVIMAGGKGNRLLPYTNILPKPLIPIGEQTIAEHIIKQFENVGCDEFYMIVNYMKNFIKTYFQESYEEKKVQFVDENEYMGTGGGLGLLKGMFHEPFFMTNCDILVEENYDLIMKFHKEKGNLATMVCAEKEIEIPYGTVQVDESSYLTELREKPKYTFLTNTGLYLLEPEFLDRIPENTFINITDLFQACIERGEQVGVYKIKEASWMDMGQIEELNKMKQRKVKM